MPFRLAFLAKARDWASLTSAWRRLDDAMMMMVRYRMKFGLTLKSYGWLAKSR